MSRITIGLQSAKLRNALQEQQTQNADLRNALQEQQTQNADLLGRVRQLEAQLAVPSVDRAIGRALRRVQQTGDRLTGGGMRSLARRTMNNLVQCSMRSRVLTALGRMMLQPFPKVATLYQLATKENSVATSRSEDRNEVEDIRKSAADFIFEDLRRSGLIDEVCREELNLVKERILTEIDHRYRGPELNLKAQLEFYLPHIREISKLGIVIDVGCGRGTFLEIMRDHQIDAIGLELNENQIENCRRKKLDVRLIDALEFLRRSEADQYGAITLFHIIEHLDFETLVTILMEAYRVVAPGGIVLMETPNAENLYVSTYMFNQDPTHVKPITYQYISTVLEVLGFECERLPVSASLHDDDGGQTGNRHLNYLLSVSANLSVIARKPRYDS